MLPDERKREIVELVSNDGSRTVDDLAGRFDVSNATIRRDLQELDDRGLIKRSHGGAVPAPSKGNEETYTQKRIQNLEAKQAIGSRAAEELRTGMAVCFDAGTTTMQVARASPDDASLITVTNSPPHAEELLGVGKVKLSGGTLREETKALVGPQAESFFEDLHLDLSYVGTNGIDVDTGLMTPNEEEARLKSLMIRQAERVILVADESKFGSQSLVRFAALDALDVVVTDGTLTDRQREAFVEADVRVLEGVG